MSHDCWYGETEEGVSYLECAPHQPWGAQEYALLALAAMLLVGLAMMVRNLCAKKERVE